MNPSNPPSDSNSSGIEQPVSGAAEPVPLLISPEKPVPRRSSLARRVSSRTTDLLAIAIVLVGSLTMGRQILEWWRLDPPPVLDAGPLAGLETEWGAEGKPVELEFADKPLRMIRQTVHGASPWDALGQVQAACQKALLAAQPLNLPPDQAERDLLQAIAGSSPEVEQAGEWQIHRIGGNMVMMVGIRFFPDSGEKSVPLHPAVVPRVICWGLVFPGGSFGSWTAYTFIKTNSKSDPSQKRTAIGEVAELDLGRIPLPDGCQRTVLVRGANWNSLSGFLGPGNAADWRSHFTSWLASQGWSPLEDWRRADSSDGSEQKPGKTSGWSASFVSDSQKLPSSNRILIQFQFDASGQGSGLIHGLPGRIENPKP